MLHFDPLHRDFSEMKGMNPFKSIVVPRPICWVSTVSVDGVDNLAPYSQFSNVGFDPHTSCSAATRSPTAAARTPS